jgi:hypothetical protein
LLAKQLHFDAVIAHHPIGGTAALDFHNVFKRHIQQMVDAGIPELRRRKSSVESWSSWRSKDTLATTIKQLT